MIYLNHDALEAVLSLDGQRRLTVADRQVIRHYRDQQLTIFCTKQAFPIPIIDHHHHGKPFCKNIPQLAFNHSHSQNHYVLAYSIDAVDLGVDIEDIDRQVRMQKLAEHCFHPDELLLWQNHDCNRVLWFKIWTIKEAVLKAHGLGIRLNLNELNTTIESTKNTGILIHPLLGKFYYQLLETEKSVITVAYRWQGQQFPIVML